MSYIALYREWRPTQFKDVVEQEHVVKALRYSVSTGRIAHAYLFCGTRGTGKTTMAHIMSRAVNCLDSQDGEPCNQCEICREILSGSSVDVLEIDAASNNSVDNVRSIRDEVIYAPTKSKRKVYIIDEVHMLSTGAFNALLKTLEEPPEHVIFILATTEPHKLPATILSRCQRFDFRRISQDSIVGHLNKIASSGDITLENDAAKLIARMADGALRDAISLLDQCISVGRKIIAYDDVLSIVGIVNDEFMTGFVNDMLDKNIVKLLQNISRLVSDGRDAAHFISDLVLYFRNLMICKSTGGKCDDMIEVPSTVLTIMKKQSEEVSLDEIMHHIRELSALENNLKYALNPRVLLEVTLIKVCAGGDSAANSGTSNIVRSINRDSNRNSCSSGYARDSTAITSLEERLTAIEKWLTKGDFPVTPQAGGVRPAVSEPGAPGLELSIPAPTYDNPHTTNAGSTDNGDSPLYSSSDVAPPTTKSGSGIEINNSQKGTAPQKAGRSKASVEEPVEFDKWPAVMNHLKSLGKMAVYSILLNIKAVSLDDNIVGLVSSDTSIRSMISKIEHIKIIEDALLKVTGHEIKIKCVDEGIPTKAASSSKPKEASDILTRARLIADKAGLPLEIIDE